MCGIAGALNLDGTPVDREALARMSQAIAHRGPDGDGVFVDAALGLAHRRLAVIDLSDAARQPMTTPDGRFVLSYNGELYNFRELRAELATLGHRFRTQSDSEVVLYACAAWGEQALLRFNGMFAFALWDTRERTLLLARDRYGVKPLYWTRAGGILLFASEVKALVAHSAYRAAVDLEGLVEYFTFQNFFTERTLFAGVSMLPAGSVARVRAGAPEIRRYWDYAFQEPAAALSADDYGAELNRLFALAVERQLVADVELGSYLSGGMDSGSITAVAARRFPYLKSFTCGFDLHSASGLELAFDERAKAELMSYLFRTEHYEMVLKAGDMERVLPKVVWHLEEPRVGQSYPNYYVAQLAAKFVKVVLSGCGGDELFAGYPWRYYRAVVNDDFEHYVDKYYQFWQRLLPQGAGEQVFRPIWSQVRHVSTRDIFRGVFSAHAQTLTRPEDYVNHSLYFEARTFLHGLLVVEDKLSMAHGLETRVPFLDNDLVDFAMRLPCRLKLANLGEVAHLNENEVGPKSDRYFQRTRDGKLILRQAMSRYVPREITEAVKQGFSAPDASWFKGESIEYVRQTLMNQRARIYDYLDREAVQALVTDHLEGRENRRLLIWSLLWFERWLDAFIA